MKIKKDVAIKFMKKNKWVFFQIGCMLLPAALGYANDASNIEIAALKQPMGTLQSIFTQSLPKIGVSIAAAAGCINWAAGIDNQFTKSALKWTAGGGLAMTVPATLSTLTGQTVTGLLF